MTAPTTRGVKPDAASVERGSHTEGPWEYGRAGNYEGWFIAPAMRLPTIAAVHNYPGQTEANARLMAAAPDMLAALIPIVEFLEKTGFASQEAKRARAAISLATTGERPTTTEKR